MSWSGAQQTMGRGIGAEHWTRWKLSQRIRVGRAIRFAVGADGKAVVALTAADTFGREAGADAFTGIAGFGRPDRPILFEQPRVTHRCRHSDNVSDRVRALGSGAFIGATAYRA